LVWRRQRQRKLNELKTSHPFVLGNILYTNIIIIIIMPQGVSGYEPWREARPADLNG